MKTKVKVLTKGCITLPKVIKQGDWIDLEAAESVEFKAPYAKCLHKRKSSDTNDTERFRDVIFDFKTIPLGVAMKLPKGFEAVVVPRSSLFKKKGLILSNSFGVIDNSYNGNDDEWGFPAIALQDTFIPVGSRICQFRIQLSQKATFWQKLRWLFSSGIELRQVDVLDGTNRGGFGSTGFC